ncbi:MAG: hypothetical protein IIC02_06635 [Planctomycetes bacterium]|nr:hypothetical protein [Planctomycetota bacterium]
MMKCKMMRPESLSHSQIIKISAALGIVGLSGCASSKPQRQEVWIPQPRVTWSEIAPAPIAPAAQGFNLLTTEPTQGLFPASIGVTRVAFAENSKGGESRRLCLLRDPRNEFLRWNDAFDDQMPIGEVFPIDQRNLAGAEAHPTLILEVFRTLHARIGFVYAVNELSEDETEMIGTLYDVATGEPLASIHAQAVSLPTPDDDTEANDLWDTDSRALVRAAFAGHVYQCIRTLIALDQSAGQESPEGWIPEGPIWPVEWPPKS